MLLRPRYRIRPATRGDIHILPKIERAAGSRFDPYGLMELFPDSTEEADQVDFLQSVRNLGAAKLSLKVDSLTVGDAPVSRLNLKMESDQDLFKIDDIGFLTHIKSLLSEEYKFVDADISYAVGWSNGGFMVTHAASLFRSISPISGHVYDIDPALKKGGTFCVDGICVDSPGPGKGIFLHHGADDPLVRPTGCCKDPDLPQCCCDIAADTCVPVEEVARNWATEVNGCAMEKGEGDDEDDAGPTFATTYSDNGIECQTAIGSDCKANTTICLHEKAGHFNSPSFIEKFPFAKEVVDFFAREACGINDGKWNATSGVCTCSEDHAGQFCLNDPPVAVENVDMDSDVNVDDFYFESGAQPSKGSNHLVSGLLLVMVALAFVRHRYKRGAKKDDRYSVDVTDEDMEQQVTELVSSRGLHMS